MAPGVAGIVQVWTAAVADPADPDSRAACEGWLTAAEQARCPRFVHPQDRAAYAAAHALLRWALATHAGVPWAQQHIVTDGHGRPALTPDALALAAPGACPHFSLSHTRGLVAVALAPVPRVGVDVEHAAARPLDLAALVRAALAEPERAWVESAADGAIRRDRFTRLWTLKEALLKAIGLGLALPLRGVALQAEPPALLAGPPPAQPVGCWQLAQWQPAAGSWAALALDTPAGQPQAEVRHCHLAAHELVALLVRGPAA